MADAWRRTQMDARRVQATILVLIPVAAGLALVEGVWADKSGNLGLWLLCTATATFAAILVPGLWLARRDRVDLAVLLTCLAILYVQLVYLVAYPRVYPAIAIASWVSVALALPFVRGRPLVALVVAAWAIAVAAVLIGTFTSPPIELPVAADRAIQLTAFLAAITVGMTLLWQFAHSMTAALAEAQDANEQLRGAHAQLHEQEHGKSVFINQAAHELNTPLTPVLLQLHLLRHGPRPLQDPVHDRMLQVVERNVERMKSLIKEMLEVARLHGGRMRLKPMDFDLTAALQSALDDFTLVAQSRHVDLSLTVPGSLRVHSDRQRVEQVVSNLVSNAVRLTPAGGSVKVVATVADGHALVRVQDTGIGLTAEQIGALFQPFTRVHDDAQQGAGTGLGLYISQGIAKELGGRLWAESPGPGKGATFSFSIPAVGPQAS